MGKWISKWRMRIGLIRHPERRIKLREILRGRARMQSSGRHYTAYGSDLEETSAHLGIDLRKKIIDIQQESSDVLDVLEIGCGPGLTLRDLLEIKGIRLHGTSLNHEADHVELRESGVDIKLCHFDDLVKRFGENSIGFIFSSYVIGHSSDKRNNFEQMYKTLKPGGKAIFNYVRLRKKEAVAMLKKTGFKVYGAKSFELPIYNSDGTLKKKTKLIRYYVEKPA